MPADETPTPESPPLFAPRAAVRFAVALLIGFAVVLAFTLRDSGRVADLERFEQTSAVGDTNYFNIPSPLPDPPTAIVQFEGKPWVPVDFDKQDFRDTQMLRVGRDDATGLALYRPRAQANGGDLFVKIEPNGYLRLQPAPSRPALIPK